MVVFGAVSGYPRRTRNLEKTPVADLWIIAGTLLAAGAGVMAIVAARRSRVEEAPAIEHIDDVLADLDQALAAATSVAQAA